MEIQKYCVYNQTSESFLSLGLSTDDSIFTYLKSILANRSRRFEEGLWAVRPGEIHAYGLFSSRDLIYLDENYRVVDVIESFPAFCIAGSRTNAASVLTLPVHTIASTQTQPGNQLVICVAEEMEFRLRTTSNLQSIEEMSSFSPAIEDMEGMDPLKQLLQFESCQNRRLADREEWPRLVAYDWTGDTLEVNGVRDISSTGLYLLTEQRWPMGSLIMVTLQRTEADEDDSEHAVTVQLKVTRWGKDGVGLMFVQPVAVAHEAMQRAVCGI